MALWTALAFAVVTLAGPPAATSCDQDPTLRCERGGPVGDLGIDALRCNCTVSIESGHRSWSFRDAPEVRAIDTDGPAAGRLERGDVLVALDGVPITLPDAGERFANLIPDDPVRLTIRRDGRERIVEITPVPICPEDARGLEHMTPVPSAAAVPSSGGQPGAVPAAPPLPPVPPVPPSMPTGWFGFGLQCRACGWEQESGQPHVVWQFQTAPVVYRVDPDGPAAEAGIRAGDTVLMIDGVALATEEGGRRFGAVQPGDRARLTIGRAGSRETVLVTTRRAPAVSNAPSGPTPAPDSRRAAPAPARHPRYQGAVGDARIEVLGTGAVIVNVPAPGREVEIITGDATIRIRTEEPDDR